MGVRGQYSGGLAERRSAEARTALEELVSAVDGCVDELRDARERADELRKKDDSGRNWTDIVLAETPPLVVERISAAMSTLSASGSRRR